MRRKAGTLVDLEAGIVRCAAAMRRRGATEFHGFELAKQMADDEDRRLLTAYGTLYRALARLETMGLLQSRREDPHVAAQANRPLRRFYTLTALGEEAASHVTDRLPRERQRRQRRRVATA